MADFSTPSLSTLYTTFLASLKARDVDAITMCLSDPTNTPTGAMKYHRANNLFQEWNGSAWVDKVLAIAGGGTGAATGAGARTALGLGSMALQNSNTVTITGGTIGSSVAIDAASIVSGTVAQARLGSGAGGLGTKYLSDLQTYTSTPPIGTILIWPGAIAPAGYFFCRGDAASRATFSELFSVIGTTFGSGDGSTTFNLPDFTARFPVGYGSRGPISFNLGSAADVYSHLHTSGMHNHGISDVYPHTHTGTVTVLDTGHHHTYSTFIGGGIGSDYPTGGAAGSFGTLDTGEGFTGITATVAIDSTGAGTNTDGSTVTTDVTAHLPPYLGINFIIKAL